MPRKERMDANLAHLIGEYRKGNWGAELLYGLTEADAYVTRNQAHRFVTKPDHPENTIIARRIK